MNVNELLDTIEDALEEGANVPLSGGKKIVDVEQIRATRPAPMMAILILCSASRLG